LENISQPVAFASAPLGYPTNPPYPRRDAGSSSDTEIDDGLATRLSKKIGFGRSYDASALTTREGSPRKTQVTVSNLRQDFDEVLADEGPCAIIRASSKYFECSIRQMMSSQSRSSLSPPTMIPQQYGKKTRI
jgi:hypothetical protein